MTKAVKKPRLLVEERRRRILEILEAQERVTVEELVGRFEVSAVTIRGDLDALAGAGAVIRSHGGARRRSEPPGKVRSPAKRPRNTRRRGRTGTRPLT